MTKVRRYYHGGQNAIFFQRTIVDIVMMALSFLKKITRDMVLPYYIVIWYTILQCNMALPYYNVIWYTILQCKMEIPYLV